MGITEPTGEEKKRTSTTDHVKFLWVKIVSMAKDVKQLGKDDPRRVYHAIKVAIAITLVSLLYYFRPIYDGFGSSTIWAVMTVVVVFEFTVGAAIYKCINRGCATLLAGVLGVGVQHLTVVCGETGRPIVLALFIFGFAACATFLRFFPYLKARFDYGFTIFILTFTMVSVTGYRAEEVLTYARTRFVTIVLGVGLVMMISIFVYPAWAGEDLHNLIANNIAKLANYLEGFQCEYFRMCEEEKEKCAEDSKTDKSFLQAYKSVLNSKSPEENLATYARWEPFHGRFRLRHPWKLYLEVGVQVRQLAYHIDALNGHLTKNNNPKVPREFKSHIEEPCRKICSESSKALKALSSSIKEMSPPSSATFHMDKAKGAVEDLKSTLRDISELEHLNLLAIMPAATVASTLIEVVGKMDKVVEAAEELSSRAGFKAKLVPKEKLEKPLQILHRSMPVTPICVDGDVVVDIDELDEGKSSQGCKKVNIV
ncbi:unnamed protein product [Rhodiola kirilowii]